GGRGRGAAPPAGGGQQGPEAFFGGRGGTPMRVRMKVAAGPHMVGATFLATNFAPVLDLDQHFMRDTLQTGPTPGFTFFPHVGTVRIEGPFNASAAQGSPSRQRIFTCRPASAADASTASGSRASTRDDELPCAKKIVGTIAARAFRRPLSQSELQSLTAFYTQGRKEGRLRDGSGEPRRSEAEPGDFEHGIEMALARILADPRFLYRIETEPANAKAG